MTEDNIKKRFWLRTSVVLPLLVLLFLMIMFAGKSKADLEALVVSSNEQYIACFEYGDGDWIHCFRTDGSLMFSYDIPAEINAGGYCALWFEEDVLCALFYRENIVVRFSLDGSIIDMTDNTTETVPSEFPFFDKKGRQYIYNGNTVNVIYDKGSYLGYWLFGAERALTVTDQNGEAITIYSWVAKDR